MKNQITKAVLFTLAMGMVAEAADLKGELNNAYTLYKKGAYTQAIDALSKIRADKSSEAMIENWLGLCHSRLQAFDKAIVHLERAYKLGAKAEDLEYEIGQAYYASNRMKEARAWFRKSADKKFKVGASLYYIGFVSQVLEEYADALSAYAKIQSLPEDSDQVKQAALLQGAEVKFSQNEAVADKQARKEKTKSEVIPAFQKAADYKPDTAIAKQALLRISQINQADAGEIPRMRNGSPIAAQPHYIRFTEDIKYDTNVITQADQALTQVSNTSSYLTKTAFFGKYEWIEDLAWVFSPEVDFSYTYHMRRDTASVYQNDAISVTTALRNRYEHTWMDVPAAFLFDVEFNWMLRDYKQSKTLPFYSRYYNFVVGHRAKLLQGGNTSLTANAKLYSNQDEGQNAFDPGVSLSQNYRYGKTASLSVSLSSDYNKARNTTNSKINYKFSTSVNFSSVLDWFDVGLSFDFTYVDTREQRSTRGYEKTLSPTLTLKKTFAKHWLTGINYNFTKNTSLDTANYAYSKHVVGLNLGCQF